MPSPCQVVELPVKPGKRPQFFVERDGKPIGPQCYSRLAALRAAAKVAWGKCKESSDD